MLIFPQERSGSSALSGKHECARLSDIICDLNRYAPQARRRSIVNHTSGHLALSCAHTNTRPWPSHWSGCTLRPFHLSLPLAGRRRQVPRSQSTLLRMAETSERPQRRAHVTDSYTKRDMARTAATCLSLCLTLIITNQRDNIHLSDFSKLNFTQRAVLSDSRK